MKRPAIQWYPGDHRRDLAVQACSFEARALWREMLDLMHDGEPYGHLTAGGVPLTTDVLARLIGKPTGQVARWLKELEDRKVFSRTDGGVIYSRRMVRDEQAREHRAAGGKLGGNPTLLARPKVKQKDNHEDKHKDKSPHKRRGNLKPTPSVALAVADAKAEEPSPRQAADGTGESAEPVTWLTPYMAVWQAQYGGPMPVEPNVQALRWLEGKYGVEETVRRWTIYLAATRSEFASAHKLKAGWGQWGAAGPVARIGVMSRGRVLLDLCRRYGLFAYNGNQDEYEAKLVRAADDPQAGPDFREECRAFKPWKDLPGDNDHFKAQEIEKRLASRTTARAS